MTTNSCALETPSAILSEVISIVDDVVSALFAVRDLTMWVSDGDREAWRVGALCGILAEKLDGASTLLDSRALLQAERPAPDVPGHEEEADTDASC